MQGAADGADITDWLGPAIEGVIGAATLVIAIAALYVARRAHRTDKDSFLAEIRREWEQLAPDWNRTLMYVYGAEHYYHEVPLDERKSHAKLVGEFSTRKATESYTPEWEWIREQRTTVARVSRFLAYASDALITGRWTVREAYAILGPNIPRHYQALLWLAHRKTVENVEHATPGGGESWHSSIDQLPEFNTFDQQDALVLLAYLLRAEQCRRGDTYAHFVAQLAGEMKGDWGKAVRRASRRASRARGRLLPRVSVSLQLHLAAHPRKRFAFQFEREPLVPADAKDYFRRPYESAKGSHYRIAELTSEAEF
ncbi:hypothetical protein [Microbacterium sp. P04]|uniref:hypothetical protein n=1 Tax=Microbacterium sp. P04 TaxID=3366947 RepID=UPI003745408C